MDPWSPDWFLPAAGGCGAPISGTIGLAGAPPQGLDDAPKDRASERVPVEMGAGLRQRGAHGVAIEIADISTHGFRATTHLDLSVGADVWLRLPGLEASQAKVVWVRHYMIGCAFERPLHPAVVDMLVGKARPSRRR